MSVVGSNNLHVLFITPAVVLKNGELHMLDREMLKELCLGITAEGGIRNILFVSQNDLASLETAHYMGDLLCKYDCKTRQFAPQRNFWMRSRAEEIIWDMCRRDMFGADLWVFVGHVPYVLGVLKIFLPEQYALLDPDPRGVPPVAHLSYIVSREGLLGEIPLHAQ